ncbi:MAG: CdaR family protein [Defluviitaleaceae bacterium]|nr:CdaR family protein [Defluviitaleaceae bacterium]
MTFLKKMYTIIFDDFRWKLIALVAAGAIWFAGMNMSDPPENYTLRMRLQLANMEIMTREGIVIVNEDDLREIDVSILVRGLRSDISYLQSVDPERLAEFIDVSVDFRAIDGTAVVAAGGISTQTLRVSTSLKPGFEQISVNPQLVDVELDMVLERSFSIQTVQAGEILHGFELHQIRLRNETVRIRGARTDVQAVSRVEASVDVTGVHGEAEQIVPITVFDSYGRDMTSRVRLNVVETVAAIHIWQVRRADISLRGAGAVAPGFAVAGISGDVQGVYVVGSADALSDFSTVDIDVDLTGANANITQSLQISDWLPSDVQLRRYEQNAIAVTARIEPIEERVFTVPHGNIRTRGVVGLYQLVDEAPVRIVVSGPRSLIAALNVSQILPEFDLRGLPIGVRSVQLRVDLPPGLSLVGAPPTLLVQIHEPVVSIPDPDDEDEPDEPEPYLPTPLPTPLPPDDINDVNDFNDINDINGDDYEPTPEEDAENDDEYEEGEPPVYIN